MNAKGIFQALSGIYFQSIKQMYAYRKKLHWTLRPFIVLIATLFVPLMAIVGLLFGVLIIFDWLAMLTDWIRESIFTKMGDWQIATDDSFGRFLFNPILILLTIPVFCLSLFLPKFSGVVGIAANSVVDDLTGDGIFRRIQHLIACTIKSMFRYAFSNSWYLLPFLSIIALAYSLVFIVVAIMVFGLRIFDQVSFLIERIRIGFVMMTQGLKNNIANSFTAFVFYPVFMLLLAPITFLVLAVPKFTSLSEFA